MAKAEKPKKENSKGRTKAANRAGTRTAANKARAAGTRARRFERNQERRSREDYIVPMNAVIPATDLPRKQQATMEFVRDSHGEPIMVPDPRRGLRLSRGPRLAAAIERRQAQTRKIARKRLARQNFSELTAKEKREARELGWRQFARQDTLHFQMHAPRALKRVA